ncbi:MAG: TerC family protein [Alphaproteobacteria bacterium]|nr:TerC family protein [Alphaproteobacteria bacterium]
MELFSAEFFSALLAIILLDFVLAGDNALVIGLAARKVPKNKQNIVILWGTIGAIAVRAAMTVGVFWLLKIPGLMLIGGVALIWIARKLLQPEQEVDKGHTIAIAAGSPVAAAVRTIIIADTVMGVDNALAIGAMARDSIFLIVFGLAITVPIIVWGSRLVLLLAGRFPSIILVAGGVLAWTAAKMIFEEPLLKGLMSHGPAIEAMLTVLIFTISVSPWFEHRMGPRVRPLTIVLPCLFLWLLAFEVIGGLTGWPVGYLDATNWPEAAMQFVRWVGWIPLASFALWLSERKAKRQRASSKEALSAR